MPAMEGGMMDDSAFIETSQCGNSTTEARALGCYFDLLSTEWWPAACQDRSTSEEFENWLNSPQRVRQWPYFRDREGKQPVRDIDELSELAGKDIWATQEYHIGHCILWWKRQHKSMEGTIGTNLWTGQFYHTAHCTSVLLETDWRTLGEVSARIPGGGGFGWCRTTITSRVSE
ncbi:hypothetical protein GGR57DRAFT_467791 [Xylariaceae sp. FL1272]|nr:hypothetical protein GGR57DRAFT_467791 [Xylariaceae sp. FL1272]